MSTATPNRKDTTNIPLTVTPTTSIPFNRIPNTKSHNHPAKASAKKVLKTFSKFVANVRMRDRIVKIIQYGCQMILGYYSIQLSDTIKSGLTETRRFSSNARKAFWLLKSFSHINSCVSLYENGILQNEYLADKFDFGEQIFLMIYFALENIVFFIRSQIITSVAECSIEFYTNASWFGADLCAFISALIRIYDVKQQLKAAKAALLIQDSSASSSSRLKNATSTSNKSMMALTDVVGRNRQNSTTTGTSSLNYQATFNAFFGLLSRSSVVVPQVLNNQRLPSPSKPQQKQSIKRIVSGPNIQNYNNFNNNNSASVVMLKQQPQSPLQSAATTTHESNSSSPSITPPLLDTTAAELNNNGSALTDKEDDDEEDDSEEEKDGEKTIKIASTATSNTNSSSSSSSSYKDTAGLTLTQDKYPFEPEVDAVVAALGESDVGSNNSNNNDDDDDDDECTIISNSTEHEYHLLRQETEKLNEIARLTKKHSDLELTVTINFFELTVSTHYMSFYKMMLGRDINDGHVGLLGVTSSVLILYEGFKNYHEDD